MIYCTRVRERDARVGPKGTVACQKILYTVRFPSVESAMKKSKASQPDLTANLRDPRESEEYMNAALEENDPELFLLALQNVAEARGGDAHSMSL